MKTASVFLLTVCFGLTQPVSADPAIMLTGTIGNPGQELGSASQKRQLTDERGIMRFAPASQELAVEFLADGSEVTAITFEIPVNKAAVVDLRNCVSNVPKTHSAVCERKDDVIRLAVFSLSNAPLETTSFGTIKVSNNDGPLKIENASFADSKGNSVSAEVL